MQIKRIGIPGKRPIIVCAGNGFDYLEDAFAFLKNGGDTLDAALKVVKGPEDDPNEDSVGLGGLPNEEGVVELDSCCMHGPTRRAGSVGGVRNIKNVSLVAKAVMEHTGHVMLVGEGAERFAVDPGFSARKPVDRAFAQNLVAVERNSFRLVGAGIVQSRLEEADDGAAPRRRLSAPHRAHEASCIRYRNRTGATHGGDPQSSVSAHRHHPLFSAERKGRDFRHHDDQRPGLEVAGTLRRFSHHRSRLLHRSGCGFGGGHGQRGREHQGRRARTPS